MKKYSKIAQIESIISSLFILQTSLEYFFTSSKSRDRISKTKSIRKNFGASQQKRPASKKYFGFADYLKKTEKSFN